MYINKLFKIIGIVTAISLISACMTLGGLSYKQVKVLKEQGFVYTDEGWTLAIPEKLLFATNEYQLSISNQNNIKELSNKLKNININKLIIQGHTDNVGNESYNQELSLKRATAVNQIFLQNGFQAHNLKAIGYSATKPIASNDTEEGRSQNRRVAIIVIP